MTYTLLHAVGILLVILVIWAFRKVPAEYAIVSASCLMVLGVGLALASMFGVIADLAWALKPDDPATTRDNAAVGLSQIMLGIFGGLGCIFSSMLVLEDSDRAWKTDLC